MAAGVRKFIPVQLGEWCFHACCPHRVLVFELYQHANLHPEIIEAGTFARQIL